MSVDIVARLRAPAYWLAIMRDGPGSRDSAPQEATELIEKMRDFVKLYRSVYMETQTRPSVLDESRVMMAARRLSGETGD